MKTRVSLRYFVSCCRSSKNSFFWVSEPLIWNLVILRQNEPPSYISTYASYNHNKFQVHPSTLTKKYAWRVGQSSLKRWFCSGNMYYLHEHKLLLLTLIFPFILKYPNFYPNSLVKAKLILDLFRFIWLPEKSENHDKIWQKELLRCYGVLPFRQVWWWFNLAVAQESQNRTLNQILAFFWNPDLIVCVRNVFKNY